MEGYPCKLDLNTKCLTKGDYCPKASCEKISSMLDMTLELLRRFLQVECLSALRFSWFDSPWETDCCQNCIHFEKTRSLGSARL